MLRFREGGGFAGGADRDDRLRALFDMEFNELGQRPVVERGIRPHPGPHRGHNCHHAACKHLRHAIFVVAKNVYGTESDVVMTRTFAV